MFPEFEFVNHSFGEFITKSLYLLFFKVSYYFLQHSMFKIIRYVVIVFALSLMPAILSKRDSGTGVFLWILWNFLEHLFSEHLWAIAFTRLGGYHIQSNSSVKTLVKISQQTFTSSKSTVEALEKGVKYVQI